MMEFHPPLVEILDAMSGVEAIAECLPLPPDAEFDKLLQLDLIKLEGLVRNAIPNWPAPVDLATAATWSRFRGWSSTVVEQYLEATHDLLLWVKLSCNTPMPQYKSDRIVAVTRTVCDCAQSEHDAFNKLAERGLMHQHAGESGGQARTDAEEPKWNVWRKDAAKFRADFPSKAHNKRAIARMIENDHRGGEYEGSAETIRRKI